MSHYSLNQNQFNQTPLIGQVARQPNVDTETCQINPYTAAIAGTIVAGCAVKLVANAGPEIVVDVMVGASDGPCFGVITYNPQKNSYAAGDRVEVATEQNIVFLLSSAAITRGARVAVTNPTTAANDPTVATDPTAGDYTLGNALTQVTGSGQIVAVRVKPAYTLTSGAPATCTSIVSP
jgi:hypothetical protein